jgi:hypothetical protein
MIIYNFLSYYKNDMEKKNLLIQVFYIIPSTLSRVLKKFIELSLIIIKVICETKIPRYYKFIFLIYQYSSYYNKFSDYKIIIINKKIYINGGEFINEIPGMLYFNRELKSGKY